MLFCNIDLLDENFECKRGQYVGVKDGKIAYIGDAEPQEDYGERYDGKHRLLMSGFYNVHSHAPMTLLRGYAEKSAAAALAGRRYFRLRTRLTTRRRTTDAAFHRGNAGERYGFVLGYVFLLRWHDARDPRERHQVQPQPRPDRVFDDSDYEPCRLQRTICAC